MIRRAIRLILALAAVESLAVVLLFWVKSKGGARWLGDAFAHLPIRTTLLALTAYAVTQLLVAAEEGFFDFESTFRAYLRRERPWATAGRLLGGTLFILAALATGPVTASLADLGAGAMEVERIFTGETGGDAGPWGRSAADEEAAALPHPADPRAGCAGCFAPVFVLLIRLAGAAVGVTLLTTGLRLTAPRGETVLRWSFLRPVLYLRSFRADAGLVEKGGGSALSYLAFAAYKVETYERSLAAALADVGPLVAIGRPYERLPPLGAARMYVGDEWQLVVERLVRGSRLVVLRAGTTEGFLWELKHLVAYCDPRKVVILIPRGMAGRGYAQFHGFAAPVFPRGLPRRSGKAPFIGFGPDWSPVLLGRDGPPFLARLRWLTGGAYAPTLRAALGERLRTLGLGSSGLPLQVREWLVLFLLIWVFIVPFFVR